MSASPRHSTLCVVYMSALSLQAARCRRGDPFAAHVGARAGAGAGDEGGPAAVPHLGCAQGLFPYAHPSRTLGGSTRRLPAQCVHRRLLYAHTSRQFPAQCVRRAPCTASRRRARRQHPRIARAVCPGRRYPVHLRAHGIPAGLPEHVRPPRTGPATGGSPRPPAAAPAPDPPAGRQRETCARTAGEASAQDSVRVSAPGEASGPDPPAPPAQDCRAPSAPSASSAPSAPSAPASALDPPARFAAELGGRRRHGKLWWRAQVRRRARGDDAGWGGDDAGWGGDDAGWSGGLV
jgi:hypothetical protein